MNKILQAWYDYCNTDEARATEARARHFITKTVPKDGSILVSHPYLESCLCTAFLAGYNSNSGVKDQAAIPTDLLGHTFAIQYNPNCPSPWLVRLCGKSAIIDMKPYSSFTPGEELTGDILGFGKTIEEAARAALHNSKHESHSSQDHKVWNAALDAASRVVREVEKGFSDGISADFRDYSPTEIETMTVDAIKKLKKRDYND